MLTPFLQENTTRKSVKNLSSLQSFISHCCLSHKYAVTIKKCGKNNGSFFSPVRMDPDVFKGQFVL